MTNTQTAASGLPRRITIDPITRLEGHGKIDIFLDDKGDVERAYLQVPELRGFEVFCLGRPAEDMPQITSRICGVCPTAHHMASTKALDDLYQVEPTSPGRKIRELVYNTFMPRGPCPACLLCWAAPISSSARRLRPNSATSSGSSRRSASRRARKSSAPAGACAS